MESAREQIWTLCPQGDIDFWDAVTAYSGFAVTYTVGAKVSALLRSASEPAAYLTSASYWTGNM